MKNITIFTMLLAFALIFGNGLIQGDFFDPVEVKQKAPIKQATFVPEPAFAPPLDLIDEDISTPTHVYDVFIKKGFPVFQAEFFTKQAIQETGDPAKPNTAFKIVSGRNNIFGLRWGKEWFDYPSKLIAAEVYAESILDSKFYSPTANPAEVVRLRNHCPEPDYIAKIEGIKWSPTLLD